MGVGMIGLAVISDGRWDYLAQTLGTLRHLDGIDEKLFVNDSGHPGPVESSLFDHTRISHARRRGLAATVRSAWAFATISGWSHLIHWEEDFLLTRPVDARNLAATCDRHQLAQVVLKRQAWNPAEIQAGGIIETKPDAYTDHGDVTIHSEIFSLNPCIIPRAVFSLGWPDSNEAGATAFLTGRGWQFGFWGAKYDPPIVEHIGAHRSAGWTP